MGLTPHVMQSFELWQPIPDAPDLLYGAWVLQLGTNHLLVVCDGHFSNGRCPVFAFGTVEALRIYDEASHRWDPELATTQPKGRPFLRVANSNWAKMVRDFGDPLSHYCIIAGDYCVELLSEEAPELRWATPAEIDALFDAGLKLGEA